MKKIGITGGIGSGKTYITKVFSALGVPVYSADEQAKKIVDADFLIREKITALLGADAYTNQKYNRKYVTEKVFNDKPLLQKLNQIIHPAVQADYENWLKKHADFSYTVKESALIFENAVENQFDAVILITADRDTKINRITNRDPHRSKEAIQSILNNQLPDEDKIKKADFIIHNNSSDLVLPQVIDIHRLFSKE